jgi:hypothetical protein
MYTTSSFSDILQVDREKAHCENQKLKMIISEPDMISVVE